MSLAATFARVERGMSRAARVQSTRPVGLTAAQHRRRTLGVSYTAFKEKTPSRNGQDVRPRLDVPRSRPYTVSMAESSLSTYLDVTKSSPAEPSEQAESESVDQAAKVIAAIHGGAHGLAELSAKTGLDVASVMGLLSALSAAGLVTVSDGDNVSAQLTDTAEKTLASS